jgi:hypothetical protein
VSVAQSVDLRTEGGGFDIYRSITWENVPLDASQTAHTVVFVFVNGGTNLCSIAVDYSDRDGSGGGVPSTTVPATPIPTPAPTLSPVTSSPVLTPTTAAPTIAMTPGGDGPTDGSSSVVAPLTWSALDYDEAFGETTLSDSFGGCNTQRNDGVDAQSTSDDTCRTRDQSSCNIGWWSPDERLVYHFDVVTASSYDVRVRTATNRSGKDLQLSIWYRGNGQAAPIETFSINNVQADGWQNYHDQYWRDIDLSPGSYELHVSSTTGSINVCSVAVLLASDDNGDGGGGGDGGGNDDSGEFVLQVPGTYSAMFYHERISIDTTPDVRTGNCPYRQFGSINAGVDAQINTDAECQSAIQPTELTGSSAAKACNIAWTEAGETLVYDFVKDTAVDKVSVTLRVAGPTRRRINVEIFELDDDADSANPQATSVVDTVVYSPGNSVRSWTTYQTIAVWNNVEIGNNHSKYRLRITFLEGRVNLCSVGIN